VANRPVNTANANATVAWTYFDDGLINTETLTALSDPARTVTYQYNADGLRSNVTYPGPAPAPAFSYSYTSRNQLDNISDGSSMQWVKYLYDLDGNRQHRKLHNAVTDTVYGTADALDRIPSISTAFKSGGTASFNYAFDAVSRLQYEQRSGGVADGYSYDLADQIIGFNRGGTLQNGAVTGGAEVMSLNFDANGNRVTTMDNNVMKSYAVNELNQYTQDLNGAPTYDTKGNLAGTGDGWAYTYDAQNRLTKADQNSTNTHVIYYYDPLNRQVARDENGARKYSVWDGWSLIQEYHGNGNLLNNYLQGAGMDEMVARFGANNANRIWYYQDGRGNTSHVADDTGALVETYTYDLGGKPFITTAAGKTSPGNRFLYNGRDYSSFTSLYDFRNRFYQPATSRFIQSDPIGFASGNHLYRFSGNSAVNAGDPMGLFDQMQHIWYDTWATTVTWTGDRMIVSAPVIPGETTNLPLDRGSGGGSTTGIDVVMLDPSAQVGQSSTGLGTGEPGTPESARRRAISEGAQSDSNGTIVWDIDQKVNVMGLAVYNFVPYGAVNLNNLNLQNFLWRLYVNGAPVSEPGWANHEHQLGHSENVAEVRSTEDRPPVALNSKGILADVVGFPVIPRSDNVHATVLMGNTIFYNGVAVGEATSFMQDSWRVNGKFEIYEWAY
jgi:RHS repeat-associated protein